MRRKPLYQVLLSELCGLLRHGSLGDLSEVQQGAHHVAGEAVLVVVPRNGTSHGHAVNGVDVGLGRIEHGFRNIVIQNKSYKRKEGTVWNWNT